MHREYELGPNIRKRDGYEIPLIIILLEFTVQCIAKVEPV